ncbi:MAG TPA: hypothetical protein DDW45_07835 [Gammaproteobacteria bacterium]|nr:hypothetical protein [Gammaproteobacteria bacterium]
MVDPQSIPASFSTGEAPTINELHWEFVTSQKVRALFESVQGWDQPFSAAVNKSLYALIKHPCLIQP